MIRNVKVSLSYIFSVSDNSKTLLKLATNANNF